MGRRRHYIQERSARERGQRSAPKASATACCPDSRCTTLVDVNAYGRRDERRTYSSCCALLDEFCELTGTTAESLRTERSDDAGGLERGARAAGVRRKYDAVRNFQAAHANGTYPVGARRLELKDEWLEADKQYAASLAPA
jgi:hypothetical protein